MHAGGAEQRSAPPPPPWGYTLDARASIRRENEPAEGKSANRVVDDFMRAASLEVNVNLHQERLRFRAVEATAEALKDAVEAQIRVRRAKNHWYDTHPLYEESGLLMPKLLASPVRIMHALSRFDVGLNGADHAFAPLVLLVDSIE